MTNEAMITKFYSSFQKKDFKSMQDCYAGHASFSDPVFKDLNASQVKAMWEMFCVNGKDLQIEFKNISADEKSGYAEWTAHYTFTATGRKVINHIKANFIINEGKIIKHTDQFSFYRWASQALGLPGLLLGWTPLMKNKIRIKAMRSLNNFIKQL